MFSSFTSRKLQCSGLIDKINHRFLTSHFVPFYGCVTFKTFSTGKRRKRFKGFREQDVFIFQFNSHNLRSDYYGFYPLHLYLLLVLVPIELKMQNLPNLFFLMAMRQLGILFAQMVLYFDMLPKFSIMFFGPCFLKFKQSWFFHQQQPAKTTLQMHDFCSQKNYFSKKQTSKNINRFLLETSLK